MGKKFNNEIHKEGNPCSCEFIYMIYKAKSQFVIQLAVVFLPCISFLFILFPIPASLLSEAGCTFADTLTWSEYTSSSVQLIFAMLVHPSGIQSK